MSRTLLVVSYTVARRESRAKSELERREAGIRVSATQDSRVHKSDSRVHKSGLAGSSDAVVGEQRIGGVDDLAV